MRELWLYRLLDSSGLRNYRLKVMSVAFLGTHVPLIALAAFVALQSSSDGWRFLQILTVALAATLIGTGVTLVVLDHLLRPIRMVADALRAYRERRRLTLLPAQFGDEVGRLMADANATLDQLDRSLEALEFSDAQTLLPNRARLARDIAGELAAKTDMAVCVIRFSDHARLADTLSLAAAEQAAAAIALRLRQTWRDDARLYRIGPADFVVLTSLATAAPAFKTAMRRRLEACSGALETASVVIKPALRAGVAYASADAEEPETLIDHALAAATLASERQPVGFHSPAARALAREQLQIEQELRRALANDELVFHYQPVVDLVSRQTVGAEALVRWRHPDRGLLFPDRFIGVAEASGLIGPIGLWGLRQACRQIGEWGQASFAPRRIAVNFSARQFLDRDLVVQVREAIEEAGVSPDALEIELTETAAMADHDYTRLVFGRLRDLGVRIAIDDFGAGFASLSYLRKLPFDKLKIDREFVTDVHKSREGQAICRALLALGDGLGLDVLAEGTETAEEVGYLSSLGCALYQGYYFAKPVSAEDFAAAALKALQRTVGMAVRQAAGAPSVSSVALRA